MYDYCPMPKDLRVHAFYRGIREHITGELPSSAIWHLNGEFTAIDALGPSSRYAPIIAI